MQCLLEQFADDGLCEYSAAAEGIYALELLRLQALFILGPTRTSCNFVHVGSFLTHR